MYSMWRLAGKYWDSPNSINLEPCTVRIGSKHELEVSKYFSILSFVFDNLWKKFNVILSGILSVKGYMNWILSNLLPAKLQKAMWASIFNHYKTSLKTWYLINVWDIL